MIGMKRRGINIKVIFINPNTMYMGTLFTLLPPMGLLYISAELLRNKHDVSIIDADIDNLSLDSIEQEIKVHEPKLVGITMTTIQCKSAFEIAETVKKINKDINVVVGGAHPSALKEKILTLCSAIDYVVVGEGEITMLELVKAIENNEEIKYVKGICYRECDGSIKKTEIRPFIKNLDSLPYPAIDLVTPLERYPSTYPRGAVPSMHILASRGCPFKCTFCSNPVWKKTVRFRSPESIIKEVEMLHYKHGVKEIFFQDDTFNLNRAWFIEICNRLIETGLNKEMVFRTPFRANKNLIDKKLLSLAKEAGFWMIFYGVESGNQNILDNIQKGIKLAEIKRAFKLTKNAGLMTLASFMIGNIGETKKTIQDTLNFAKEIDPDFYGFAIATPYPDSEFYLIAKERGYIQEDFLNYNPLRCVISTENLTKEEIEKSSQFLRYSLENYKHTPKYKIRKFLESLLIKGFSRALWEVQDYREFSDHDYRPIYKDKIIYAFLEDNIRMGSNDSGNIGKGWYHLETWPDNIKIRWSTKKAITYLKNNENYKSIKIKFFTNANLEVSMYVNNRLIKKTKSEKNIWQTLEGEINDTGLLELKIELDRTWVPDEILNNGDTRELGIAVHKIWLE